MQRLQDREALCQSLTRLEGSGVGSCWDGQGELTLAAAERKFAEFQLEMIGDPELKDYPYFVTIYGNGGWCRYTVNLATGEVMFSVHHSSGTEKTTRAIAEGFGLS